MRGKVVFAVKTLHLSRRTWNSWVLKPLVNDLDLAIEMKNLN